MPSVSVNSTPLEANGARRVTTPVVGRVHEQAGLDAAWASARSGHSTLVVLDGPAGFGKSLLSADLIARHTPTHVVRTVAELDEADVEYALLGQLLRAWPDALPANLHAIARGQRVDVDPLAAGVELLNLFDGLEQRSTVVVVDDVQLADNRSVRALVFAIRRASDVPVLTLLTCRSELSGRLPPSLLRLVNDQAVRVTLPPFGADEARDLAGALGHPVPEPRAAQRIVEHADGNPLYVRAVLDELGSSGPNSDGALPVPASYALLIEAKLGSLGTAAAALVAATAVTMIPRPIGLVSSAAGVAEPFAAVDAAVAAGLLQRPGRDGTLRMVHPLARAAVHQATPLATLTKLHRALARLLDSCDRDAALRHRAAATAGTDDDLAEQFAQRATADFDAKAWNASARWFGDAVRLSDPTAPAHSRFLLRRVEASVLGAEASSADRLRADLEPRPPTALRDYLLARVHTLTGDLGGAQQLARSAWSLAQTSADADADLLARIAAELARTELTIGHAACAAEWAEQAMSLTPDGSDAGFDSMGTKLLAVALQGGYDRALAVLDGLPLVIGEPTAAHLDGMIVRGMLSLWNGDLGQAESDLATVVRATRRDGPMHLNLGASAYLSDVAYRTGDWDTAINEAETALALARDLDHTRTLPMLSAAAATALAARGHFTQAQRHVADALATAPAVGDMQTRLWARAAAARLAHAQQDAAGVVAAVEPLVAMADQDGPREPGVQPWQCEYAAALARLGRADDAERTLVDHGALAGHRKQPVQQMAALRTRASLALADDRLHDAAELLARATQLRTAIAGHPFDVARLDLVHGQLARRTGSPRAAADLLQSALDTFVRLKAAPWTTWTEHELARCGLRRPARRTRATDLTATEGRIAGLVATGMTNREIATHLVVSVKTIEYHLSNSFTKLGIHSRVQLATRYAGHADRSEG